MSNNCEHIREQIGELLDGELAERRRAEVERHVSACDGCQRELTQLRSLARRIGGNATRSAPPQLWSAIEDSLDDTRHVAAPSRRTAALGLPRWPLAAAAAVLLAIGFGWVATVTPWESRAQAAQLDFRPLLERANGDVGAGIRSLMRTYGGEPISAEQAASAMTVRVHAPEKLPRGLHLEGRYLLNMAQSHRALAFHYVGPDDAHLLLLQCPPDVEKNYGNFECIACAAGAREGHDVQVGPLRLSHLDSANVCVCIVSTLDEANLEAALDAVEITF